RSITSSSCSNTLCLSEYHLQLLPRALHPHLERRHARPGQPCHGLVFEILDVLEQERLAVFRREPRERPADDVLPLGALGRARVRGAVERRVVAYEHPAPPRG